MFPFVADIYIVSRILKGYTISLMTGRPFRLEDELFALQRTFALLEVQMESVKNIYRNWTGFVLLYFFKFSK